MKKTLIFAVLILSVLLLVAGCKKQAAKQEVMEKKTAPITAPAQTDAASAEVADIEKDLQDIEVTTSSDVSDIDKDLGEFSLN